MDLPWCKFRHSSEMDTSLDEATVKDFWSTRKILSWFKAGNYWNGKDSVF